MALRWEHELVSGREVDRSCVFDHARRGSPHSGARSVSTDSKAPPATDGGSRTRSTAIRATRIRPPAPARRGTTRKATERRRLDAGESRRALRKLRRQVRGGRRGLPRRRCRLVFTPLRWPAPRSKAEPLTRPTLGAALVSCSFPMHRADRSYVALETTRPTAARRDTSRCRRPRPPAPCRATARRRPTRARRARSKRR